MNLAVEPLDALCQRALSWHAAGLHLEAGRLAGLIARLKPFPALWATEKEYQEQKVEAAFQQLQSIPPIADWEPDASLLIYEDALFTWAGRATSLGMIRMGEVEIRAFGPQRDASQFGIKGVGLDGWARVSFLPEVWLHMKPEWEKKRIAFRFVGLETSMFLAFYVKAPSCTVGSKSFLPGGLHRFQGEAQEARFGSVVLKASTVCKMELIPLAGHGCFWNADFLLLFEINQFFDQINIDFIFN